MRSSRASRVSVALAFAIVLVFEAENGAAEGLAERANEGTADPSAAAPPDFATLLAAFRSMPGLEAAFVEEKHLALLAAPLRSEGRLYFVGPSYFAKRVHSPAVSAVVITPDTLRFSGAGGDETLDLSARPEVRQFVDSLMWLLAGDDEALSAVYQIDYRVAEGDATDWRVDLRPLHPPLSHLIAVIRVEGTGLAVSSIVVEETSGDRTVTRITEADPARVFSAAERREFFGVERP